MHLDIPGLVDSYGYLAVAIGSFLEGETVLALGGLAAYRGYLNFFFVVAIALLAGFAGDQFYFYLGRTRGSQLLARFPRMQERAHRFDAMLSRWHAPLIVCIRFMYGFRIMGPILLGMGRVAAWKFVVFNFIGAALWAPLVAGVGFLFGSVLETLLRDLDRYELWAVAAIILAGLASLLLGRLREKN